MTSIKMLLSYNNNEKVVQLPVMPNELPEVLQSLSNEEFETHTKTLMLLGNKTPRSFSLDLFLPTKSYYFAAGSNGTEVIELLDYVSTNKIPARLVIVDNLTELLNIAVSIQNYKYKYDTAGNIRANVSFSEYMFLIDETAESTEDEVVFDSTVVYYNDSSVTVKSLNNNGSLLVYTRDVLNLLGIDVGWNAEKKRVWAGKVLLDIHTEIYDGCAFCYIREMAAALGYDVEWNANDKSVTLKDGD